MMPSWAAGLMPSDWMMFAFAALLLFFVLDYGIFTPWWKAPISGFVFEYGLAVLALVGLIVYGTIVGERADEWARQLVVAGLCVGITGKIIVLKDSRRKGRIERRRLALEASTTERTIMDSKTEAVATATEIWYKGKRVLRTLVQVGIPSFLSFALVLPLIIEALGLPVDSELRLWLVAVAAGVTAVAGALARVMAIPAVNAWLIKVGLGSVPEAALTPAPVAVIDESFGAVEREGLIVEPDPKVG